MWLLAGGVMDKSQVMAVVAAVAIMGVSLAWYAGRAPQPVPAAAVVTEERQADLIAVHVSGAVNRPGVVHLQPGARAADAVAAAGGASRAAALAGINLAARLTDGQQIVVPSVSDTTGVGSVADGRLVLNRASVDELVALQGVGPVLAERIVAHREQFGPFSTIEDLLDVPGIGEGKLSALRDQIVVP